MARVDNHEQHVDYSRIRDADPTFRLTAGD
jgi:hypothetical protein